MAPDLTLSQSTPSQSGTQVAVPQLFVVFPGGALDAPSTRHRLTHVDVVDVGRGAVTTARRATENGVPTLALALEDGRVSTKHARLVRTGARWRLEDRGSKNGTLRNGQRCTEAMLEDGDVVVVGQSALLYRDALTPDPQAPADGPAGGGVAGVDEWRTFHAPLATQYRRLAQLAGHAVPVLVLGEPGTGKEVVARVLHRLSARGGELVAVNCAAVPESLAESELFGVRKGAFTGAAADRAGWIRSAHGGTLFLDEIGEMPLGLQAKFLRTLETREVLPVGADRAVPVDFRLVSATNRDLDAMVERETFRADLRGRLGTLEISLPPLRDRREDLGILVAALLRSQGIASPPRLTAEAATALLRARWAGNVRELSSALAQALALAGEGPITAEHLPHSVTRTAPPDVLSPALEPAQAEQRAELEALLQETRGNVAEVARRLGKHRELVYRALERLRLDPALYRRGAGEP